MPATADRGSLASYARFPPELDRDWLGRVCHLSRADLAVIRRRTDPVTQLGYATQLVTVRAIGTFQPDPPRYLSRRGRCGTSARHRRSRRARRLSGHASAVASHRRDPGPLRVSRLRRATRPVRLHRLVVPSGLGRRGGLVGVVPHRPPAAAGPADHAARPQRADAAGRYGARTRHSPGPQPSGASGRPGVAGPLGEILLVPEGQRRSELDLLRRPPFTPTITGLVRALDRLDRIRGIGAGDLDLSGVPLDTVVARTLRRPGLGHPTGRVPRPIPHMAGAETREPDLPETLSALLVSEACKSGSPRSPTKPTRLFPVHG